jgi:hypothetical protein
MKLINKEIIDNKWSQNEYELDSLNLGKEPELIGVVIANIIIQCRIKSRWLFL